MQARTVEFLLGHSHPGHHVRAGHVRAGHHQVQFPGVANLPGHRVRVRDGRRSGREQEVGVGLDPGQGQGGPARYPHQDDREQEQGRRPDRPREPAPAGHPWPRPGPPGQGRQQRHADDEGTEPAHSHAQREEQPELADQWDAGDREGQNTGRGGGRRYPRRGQDGRGHLLEPAGRPAFLFCQPVHTLQNVIGGQAEHHRQDHQGRGQVQQRRRAGGPDPGHGCHQHGQQPEGNTQDQEGQYQHGHQRSRQQELE